MATTEEPPIAADASLANAQPYNQENEDPDAPDALREMFMDGINKIQTHK